MIIRELRKKDFDLIVEVIDRWWGGPTTALAHPMFFYEFGSTALVADEEDRLIGFLFGLVADEPRVGYIHLVGVDPAFRKHGVGRALYERFERTCRDRDVRQIKAITTVGNAGSREFHQALDFEVEESSNYAGPGRSRLVFRKSLA